MSARRSLLLFGALAIGVILAPGAGAHPIHTTLTELVYDPRSQAVEVVIRVFADDFGAAVARATGGPVAAPAMAAYLSGKFVVQGPSGQRIPLRWQGAKQTEEVIWIRLQGKAPGGLRGGSIRNELVFDVHTDQVNIVKARYHGKQHTLLFTRAARAKRLP